MDTSCIGFCLLKKAASYVTEGKVEEGLKWWKTRNNTSSITGWPSRNERILEIERGSTRSLSMENSLCKRLWTMYLS